MAKKNQEESGGNWMDTYGDMVTLLLTFFVMLYSMSSVVEDKWVALVSAFKVDGDEKVDQMVFIQNDDELGQTNGTGLNLGTFEDDEKYEGTVFNSAIDDLYDKIRTYIDKEEMSNSILLKMTSENDSAQGGDKDSSNNAINAKNIYIQFKDNVLFNPDQATIRPESEEVLQFLGECLSSVQDQIKLIIIKGHTAISPSSPVDSRLLSTERAGKISNFFEYKCAVPSTLLVPLGLGSDYPVASNDNEEGRSQNRRVEIVIVNKNSSLGESNEFLKAIGASFDSSESLDVSDIVK